MSTASIEEMVEWALANPTDGRFKSAGREALMRKFGLSHWKAQQVARIVAERRGGPNVVPRSEKEGKAPDTGYRYSESGNTASLVVTRPDIRTVEDALRYAEVDTDVWEPYRSVINKWEMGFKDAEGEAQTQALWQVKVWLRRRVRTALEDALEALIGRMHTAPPRRYKPRKRTGKRMVEVALYDLHFGMLAWAPETGENYDTRIAREVTGEAVAEIARRTAGLGVEYYLFPIGNDLFHVNDPSGLTPMSKNVLDVDSRLPKIIEEAGMALRDAVETLAAIAPVKLIWVPGNHDPQTSYWMLRELAAYYGSNRRVEVDTSPRPRKIERYGVNLIWFLHGSDLARSNEKALAGLFASEAAHLWEPNQYREIHRGHTHKKNELWFVGAETYGGVVVRTIPSLVATDAWHFSKGFVGTTKMAQYFVWNKQYGLEGVHDVHARQKAYHRTER